MPAPATCRLINNQRQDYRFVFNGILTADAKQDEVFERVCRPSVDIFMTGINSTIFAYGQTGSGKTFTITGGPERYAGASHPSLQRKDLFTKHQNTFHLAGAAQSHVLSEAL